MSAARESLGLPAGFQLDRFRLEKIHAAWGFCLTYLAEDTEIGRRVAVHELLPEEFATRGADGVVRGTSERAQENLAWARTEFLREGRVLAKCDHPALQKIFRGFEANGTAYLVTPGDEPRTFKDWLRDLLRPPSQTELRPLLAPLLDALEQAHAAGLLHLNLKPDAIQITNANQPVLTQFFGARQAIARRCLDAAVVTGGYSAPEQYDLEKTCDARTDIYSLAAVLHRALTGQAPPDAEQRLARDTYEPLAARLARRYRADFLAALDAALALDPAARPQTIGAWRKMLALDEPEDIRLDIVRGHPRRIAAVASAVIIAALWLVFRPVPDPHDDKEREKKKEDEKQQAQDDKKADEQKKEEEKKTVAEGPPESQKAESERLAAEAAEKAEAAKRAAEEAARKAAAEQAAEKKSAAEKAAAQAAADAAKAKAEADKAAVAAKAANVAEAEADAQKASAAEAAAAKALAEKALAEKQAAEAAAKAEAENKQAEKATAAKAAAEAAARARAAAEQTAAEKAVAAAGGNELAAKASVELKTLQAKLADEKAAEFAKNPDAGAQQTEAAKRAAQVAAQEKAAAEKRAAEAAITTAAAKERAAANAAKRGDPNGTGFDPNAGKYKAGEGTAEAKFAGSVSGGEIRGTWETVATDAQGKPNRKLIIYGGGRYLISDNTGWTDSGDIYANIGFLQMRSDKTGKIILSKFTLHTLAEMTTTGSLGDEKWRRTGIAPSEDPNKPKK